MNTTSRLSRMFSRPFLRSSSTSKHVDTAVASTTRRTQRVHVSTTTAALGDRPELLFTIFEAPGHHLEDHVERPGRVQGIVRALTAAKLLGAEVDPVLKAKMKEIPPSRQGTMEEVALIHTYGEDLKAKSAVAKPDSPVAVAGTV